MSGSYEYLFRFVVQKKSQTFTRIIQVPLEMPTNFTKVMSNVWFWMAKYVRICLSVSDVLEDSAVAAK